MNSVMTLAKAVVAKDLRTEFRSRVVTNQVLPFAGVVLLLFAFAIDSDSTLARTRCPFFSDDAILRAC